MSERDPLDPLLANAVSQLRDRQPERDLWPGIAPRLATKLPPGTFVMRWPVALAAGIAVAIASAGGTMLAVREQAPVAPSEALAGRDAALATPNAPTAKSAGETGADGTLVAEIGQLESALARGNDRLDPRTRASVEQSLAALDDAITEIQKVQRDNPGNIDVAKYLTATLEKKRDVLRSITQQTSIGS